MLREVWQSFHRLPLWVRLWMALWLVPVNLWSLAHMGDPNGAWIAGLAVAGMLPNVAIMAYERGLSKLMALPHLIFWLPCVLLVAVTLLALDVVGGYRVYLWVLLATHLVSLAFDVPDVLRWRRGAREIV